MPRYTLRHNYTARRDGVTLGPWVKGAEVEIDDADAAWIDRDSPGALEPVKPAVKKVARRG